MVGDRIGDPLEGRPQFDEERVPHSLEVGVAFFVARPFSLQIARERIPGLCIFKMCCKVVCNIVLLLQVL